MCPKFGHPVQSSDISLSSSSCEGTVSFKFFHHFNCDYIFSLVFHKISLILGELPVRASPGPAMSSGSNSPGRMARWICITLLEWTHINNNKKFVIAIKVTVNDIFIISKCRFLLIEQFFF